MKLFLTIFLFIFSAAFTLTAARKQHPQPAPEEIRKLIERLGSNSFEMRKSATDKLIQFGYYAKKEVRANLNAEDPEVRMRLKKIWDIISWQPFPGAGEDIRKFVVSIQAVDSKDEDWLTLAGKYGPKLLLLSYDIYRKQEFSIQPLNGLDAVLKKCGTMQIVEFLKGSPKKKNLLQMINSFDMHRRSVNSASKLITVLIHLGEKEQAAATAAELWDMFPSSKLPDGIQQLFSDRKFTEQIFEDTARRLNHAESSKERDWTICFFAKVAKNIKRKDLVRKILMKLDYTFSEERAIVYLAKILISLKLYGEAINVLTGVQSPRSVYLRAAACHNAEKLEQEKHLMKILDSKMDSEAKCYSVALEMKKFHDKRLTDVLNKILQIKPDNSIYDVNARFMLGAYYEVHGRYQLAADMYESGVKQLKKINGAVIASENSIGTGDGEQTIINKIRNLKQQVKGGEQLWFNAITALDENKFESALQNLNEFIRKNPDYDLAYYQKSIALMRLKKLDEALDALNLAINLAGEKEKEYLFNMQSHKSQLLQKLGRYEEAADTLEKIVNTYELNDKKNILINTGMDRFYAGQYKKCAAVYSEILKNENDPYVLLIKHLALLKLDRTDTKFAKSAESVISAGKWPAPVFSYYLGKISAEECLKAAESDNNKKENEQKCEAYFYIGELYLHEGKKQEALKYYRKCIDCGITEFFEYTTSGIRIKELNK